jgi:hypothetical protein
VKNWFPGLKNCFQNLLSNSTHRYILVAAGGGTPAGATPGGGRALAEATRDLFNGGGLYKLIPADPQLERARFQSLNLSSEKPVSKFARVRGRLER